MILVSFSSAEDALSNAVKSTVLARKVLKLRRSAFLGQAVFPNRYNIPPTTSMHVVTDLSNREGAIGGQPPVEWEYIKKGKWLDNTPKRTLPLPYCI